MSSKARQRFNLLSAILTAAFCLDLTLGQLVPILAAAPISGESDEALLARAKSLVHEFKHKEADEILEELVRRNPKNAKYHYLLARGLTEEGRFQKAVDELFECSLLEPNNNRARMEIAQVYVYQARFKDAVAVLQQIKSRSPVMSRDYQQASGALDSIAAFYQLGDPKSLSYADVKEDLVFKRSDFPIKVAIWSDPELPQLKEPFRQAVIDSFTKWRNASGGWLRFEIVDEQRKAKIVCKLVRVMRGSVHDGGGIKLGETLADYDRKNADLRGSARVEIFWDENNNPNFFKHTVLHEVGHALGLGHSNNVTDVMYPFVHPPYPEYPSQRDRNSIKALYGISN